VECTVERVFSVADHTLLIGDVEAVVAPDREGGPLLYFDRTFHSLGEPLP
jgi:flavin reductase (DIM6/NTAB) family NADH-FMN oxidoreductase RutF